MRGICGDAFVRFTLTRKPGNTIFEQNSRKGLLKYQILCIMVVVFSKRKSKLYKNQEE